MMVHLLMAPAACWILMATNSMRMAIFSGRHSKLALRSSGWHKVEPFLLCKRSFCCFWLPRRAAPSPFRPRWPPLVHSVLYLLGRPTLLILPLSATLTFSEHVLYPTPYAHVPQLFAASALSDQGDRRCHYVGAGLAGFYDSGQLRWPFQLLSPTLVIWFGRAMTSVRSRASAVAASRKRQSDSAERKGIRSTAHLFLSWANILRSRFKQKDNAGSRCSFLAPRGDP